MEPHLFEARAVNHVALRVTDIQRSREFYRSMFGARVIQETEKACFLGVGDDDFVALFTADSPHIEHFCLTIDGYDPDSAERDLVDRGLEVSRREDRVFFKDPDGLLVQVSGPNA